MKLPNGERAIVDIRKLAGILPEFHGIRGVATKHECSHPLESGRPMPKF
jgi:hypothetical protein